MQIDVGGCLLLDKTEVEVQQLVNVYWDFSNYTYVPNSKDFIGVLEVGMTLCATPLDMSLLDRGCGRIVQIDGLMCSHISRSIAAIAYPALMGN